MQSVALRMICDREKEVKAFVPEEYWTISAGLDSKIECTLNKIDGNKAEIKNEEEANRILDRITEDFKLNSIVRKSKNRASYMPFITSTLQQEASSKLGFGAKKTMSIAQGLYEGVNVGGVTQGLITYMRSDSTRFSNDFLNAAFSKIENDYGREYKGRYRVKNDENSQDAHEAIRPTSLDNEPEKIKEYLTNDQYKLYKLIYARALASLMADAKVDTTSYIFENEGMEFTAAGSVTKFDGFLKIYNEYDFSKEVKLPELNEGDILKCHSKTSEQHFTEGPGRYTEAKLIKALEEEGVGRPSTYATILDTIVERGYVELKKESPKSKVKYFFPTEQGIITDEKLREYFSSIINVKYTASMESKLDEIADGNADNIAYLRKFYDEFEPLVLNAYDKMEKIEPEKVGETCPECGGDLIYRTSRFGRFIACSNYPECKYSRPLVEKKKEPSEPLGRDCPRCGKPLLKRKSRYGTYFAGCSGYPKCNYMETLDGEEITPKTRKKTARKQK